MGSQTDNSPSVINYQESTLAWSMMPLVIAKQAVEYAYDAWQRSVLFLDVMRRRGNDHFEHEAEKAPNVLRFDFDVVMKGWELERPVNYALVRIRSNAATDPRKRPFIIFDPRAGHGPGIGGMKHDSEIGVVLAAGHPCYFVGFLPDPQPGQTIEDICRAEATFVEKVCSLHPEADGKPCLIGNCQAGWQIAMMAALSPDLPGPLLLAGSPLSYWAGVHGKNPMRYLGGLFGGTWATSLAGDLGNGTFDGAYLVSNFEALNPANTYWEKPYNVYSKVDTEGPRFLEFEKWWGSPVRLKAKEMQFIADELFVGNKLAAGRIYTSDGVRIDLRNIKSPIVVFCSFGDNITPPQQALDWVLDLYGSDDELVASGQTIIYALHETVGHLGIFVSAKVATKEHDEFVNAMDLIDVLPPGLYEAVFFDKKPETTGLEFVSGNHIVRFEARSLDNIRALGGNDEADNRRFATVARVSEIGEGVYQNLVSPVVRSVVNDYSADWLQRLHPYRMRYELLSDKNPFLQLVGAQADLVRLQRRETASGNGFVTMERLASQQIANALDMYRDFRDRMIESWFMWVYGSPVVQAMIGLGVDGTNGRQSIGHDVFREAIHEKVRAELAANIGRGGLREAAIRSLLYIGLGEERPGVDERGFAVLSRIREKAPNASRMSLARFKELVREQYLLLRLDEPGAMAVVPEMLADSDTEAKKEALSQIREIIEVRGALSERAKMRLAHVEALFDGFESTLPADATEERGDARRRPERTQGEP
jgi:hypothetical protein